MKIRAIRGQHAGCWRGVGGVGLIQSHTPYSRITTQINLLLAFEEYCTEGGPAGAAFQAIVTPVFSMLYDTELVSEEAFVAWAEEKQLADASERRFLELAKPFMTWLEEAAEESEESESEESESD